VAIEIDPSCTPAYYGLAAACERMGQKEAAKTYRQKFKDLEAKDRSAGMGGKRGYDDLTSLRQGLVDAYVTAANVYLTHHDVEQAVKHWSKASGLDPKDTESRKALASVYGQQNKAEEALRVLEELLAIEPENPVHHRNAGALNIRLQRFDAAEEAFQKAGQLAPDRPEAHVALAQLYLETNRELSQAWTHARKAVELEPIAANYFLLSSVCERNGDHAGALTAIKRARDLDPGDPRYKEAYARIQEKR
jgi:tetratricopeptide (TPR) repeat protein